MSTKREDKTEYQNGDNISECDKIIGYSKSILVLIHGEFIGIY